MTTTVKAKCPGCGDEEGMQAYLLQDGSCSVVRWWCSQCKVGFGAYDCFKAGKTRTLTDADIDAIASRVVEMMKECA